MIETIRIGHMIGPPLLEIIDEEILARHGCRPQRDSARGGVTVAEQRREQLAGAVRERPETGRAVVAAGSRGDMTSRRGASGPVRQLAGDVATAGVSVGSAGAGRRRRLGLGRKKSSASGDGAETND